jgi:hypothetical protein
MHVFTGHALAACGAQNHHKSDPFDGKETRDSVGCLILMYDCACLSRRFDHPESTHYNLQ